MRQRYQSSSVRSILDIVDRERLVAILGDPGSGKTSLIKYLCLSWAVNKAGPLPLSIDLKTYVRQRIGLLAFIESGCTSFGLNAAKVEEALKAGEAALYLDGLDEVFDGPDRGSIVEEITAFVARYPAARVVLTSRLVGYEPETLRSAGFSHATLEDFDASQVVDFLQRWHNVAEEESTVRERLQRQLERALSESKAIRELSGNPLLLTMMAILNRNQDLPRDRVELYREASRVLLHEWDASRSLPVDAFARQEKEALLRALAGSIQAMEGGLTSNLIARSQLVELFRKFLNELGIADSYVKALSVVQQLTERNFVLCFAGGGRFSFVHRTFLEYFCAAWFVDLFQVQQTMNLSQLKQDVFVRHWQDESWHEVLRLITGMVGEQQAAELIRLLIDLASPGDKMASLFLATGCLSEVRNRRAIKEIDDLLKQKLLNTAIRYAPAYYYEPYREWFEVGSTRQAAVHLLAIVWRDQQTHAWLRQAAEGDVDWIVRQAALMELARGWRDEPNTLSLVKMLSLEDDKPSVRRAAIHELARGWRDHLDTFPSLKTHAIEDDKAPVRQAALQELARRWKEIPEILGFLKERSSADDDLLVRQVALQEVARGWRDDPQTLAWLIDRSETMDPVGIQWAAVQEVARGWPSEVDTRLAEEKARSSVNPSVRQSAMEELARGWQDDKDVLPMLSDLAVNDSDGDVRRLAVQELARSERRNSDVFKLIKDRAINDPDKEVRRTATQELSRQWKESADMLQWLKDRAVSKEQNAVLRAVVQEIATGWRDDPNTLPWLKTMWITCGKASGSSRRAARNRSRVERTPRNTQLAETTRRSRREPVGNTCRNAGSCAWLEGR